MIAVSIPEDFLCAETKAKVLTAATEGVNSTSPHFTGFICLTLHLDGTTEVSQAEPQAFVAQFTGPHSPQGALIGNAGWTLQGSRESEQGPKEPTHSGFWDAQKKPEEWTWILILSAFNVCFLSSSQGRKGSTLDL